MLYITGIFALNLNCSLHTFGDWHQSALNWNDMDIRESEDSPFGDYGIEQCGSVPEHVGCYYAANHIRALLDMLYAEQFSLAQGMRNDFIGVDEYNEEIFQKVFSMKSLPQWDNIDKFMEREYKLLWIRFKERVKNGRLEDSSRENNF